MSSPNPIDMTVVNVNTTTNATINTTNSGTLITAPGPTQVIRLWGIAFGPLPANTGSLWMRVITGAIFIAEIAAPAKGSAALWIPGGIRLNNNTALTYNNRSEVATQAIDMFGFYTLETF